MQKTDENGKTKIYGIAEIQDGPYMSSATQMLRQREQLLHNIYKHLPVGIEVYNTDGVLTDLNDKELEMFHLQRKEDLLGINIFDNPIFPKEMKEKLKKYDYTSYEDDVPYYTMIIKEDGQKIKLLLDLTEEMLHTIKTQFPEKVYFA